MKQLVELTNNAKQSCRISLEDGTYVLLSFAWRPTQLSWYFDFEYKNIISRGNKLVLSCNLLRQFKNIIPFGIMTLANDGIDPYSIDDLSKQRVTIYILDKGDVEQLESEIYNG